VTSGFWRAHGERAIYDSPWVWLGQVDVEPPGGDRYWHHVVRLRKAAVMALVDGEERVLMLWRHRFVPDRWGWELPGGLVDDGEEPADPAEAARVEWVPLASVPGLLAAGDIWSAASVAALPLLLMRC
jgi:hypothetical protein